MDPKNLRVAAVLTAVGMIVGGLGEWASALGGLVSVNGGDRDGAIVIVCAVIFVLAFFVANRAIAIIGLVVALAAAATAIYDTQDIMGDDSLAQINVGWGLWLSLIASIVAVVLAVLRLRLPAEPASSSPPPPPPPAATPPA